MPPSHLLIVAVGLAVPVALWLRQHPPASSIGRLLPTARARVRAAHTEVPRLLSERDALLTLAFLLLLRCLLDTWDAVYYPLPFVPALLAWEVSGPSPAPAGAGALERVLAWISCQWLPAHGPPPTSRRRSSWPGRCR